MLVLHIHLHGWMDPRLGSFDSEVGSDGRHCDDKRWQCYFARGGSEVNIHHMYVGKTGVFFVVLWEWEMLLVLEKRRRRLEITNMPGLVKVFWQSLVTLRWCSFHTLQTPRGRRLSSRSQKHDRAGSLAPLGIHAEVMAMPGPSLCLLFLSPYWPNQDTHLELAARHKNSG